jgi:hypothetical protein
VLTYDETRNVTIIHGGSANGTTRVYDGTVWTLGANNGPQRNRSAMTFDPGRGEALMYSGNSGSCECSAFRTLNAWNGTAWTVRYTRDSLFTEPGLHAGDGLR